MPVFNNRQNYNPRRGRDTYFMLLIAQLFHQIAQMQHKPPVTLALIGANFLIFFKNMLPYEFQVFIPSIEEGCMQPYAIIKRQQWARLLWAGFLHADEGHIYYNMSSLLWKGSQLEPRLGSVRFAALIAELLLVSHGLFLLGSFGLASGWQEYRALYYQQRTVGFSAVLFGLKVVLQHNAPGFSNIMGFTLPTKYLCWAELFLISFITPNASFLGHLAGICAGLIHVRYSGYVADAVGRWWRRWQRYLGNNVAGGQFFSSGGRLGNTGPERRTAGPSTSTGPRTTAYDGARAARPTATRPMYTGQSYTSGSTSIPASGGSTNFRGTGVMPPSVSGGLGNLARGVTGTGREGSEQLDGRRYAASGSVGQSSQGPQSDLSHSDGGASQPLSPEELRAKRLERFGR